MTTIHTALRLTRLKLNNLYINNYVAQVELKYSENKHKLDPFTLGNMRFPSGTVDGKNRLHPLPYQTEGKHSI